MANGVEVRGNRLRLYWRQDGRLYREPLDLEATPEHIARAEHMAALIAKELAAGTFEHARWFPRSHQLGANTLGAWLDTWMDIKQGQVAESTLRLYRLWVSSRIRPRWGAVQAETIDYLAVESWIAKDLADLSNKSIREIVAILRQVYRLYRTRHPAAMDPTEGVRIRLPDADDPDPFTRPEIDAILSAPTDYPQALALVRFLLWSGPRVSEAIALAWEDVDLTRGTVQLRRAKIQRARYKATKTRSSARRIDLLRPAREAVEAQWERTGSLPPRVVEVVGRDNRTVRREPLRFVFLRELPNGRAEPWQGDRQLRERFFAQHLDAAGVRYRGPGQCRHTFASQSLTAGLPPAWIAQQMGHTSIAMLERHYTKWLHDDATDLRAIAEAKLGL